MTQEKLSYVYEQMRKREIDYIVVNRQTFSCLDGETFSPLTIEGALYIEQRDEHGTLAMFDFWTVDEIHYKGETHDGI